MLSPLFNLIANSNLKQINLTLTVDPASNKPVVLIQSQLEVNTQHKLLHPANTGQVADVYSKLATPLVVQSENIDEIDIVLSQDILQFAESSGVALSDSNIEKVLAQLKASQTVAAKSATKTATKQADKKQKTPKKNAAPVNVGVSASPTVTPEPTPTVTPEPTATEVNPIAAAEKALIVDEDNTDINAESSINNGDANEVDSVETNANVIATQENESDVDVDADSDDEFEALFFGQGK
ncbi:hypothetical protein VAS14_00101 [Vibrio angustum S14]|uniref:Uncharacterized protein n=1 Tax=Photobacterium angustum (strain S14 / CCUG 15956) TaxID=314292 RepID=Q1ZJU9_PHOAS|nr:hypothetical protein [Photobacterium angustum]EAS62423.1 hypothetical protein VAS14_00101 [Vibrio angustum S14] [Photobacterium angustum S14]